MPGTRSGTAAPPTNVPLTVRDMVPLRPCRWRPSATRLDELALPAAHFDSVVSVDSAYHFAPRTAFLRHAYRLLRPGGHLALTDIVRGPGRMSWFGEFMLARAFQIPPANWVDPAAYEAQLRQLGFVDVRVEILDDAVFPGLAGFLERQAEAWHGVTGALPWAPFLATAAGLRAIVAARSMHFVLVSAVKPA